MQFKPLKNTYLYLFVFALIAISNSVLAQAPTANFTLSSTEFCEQGGQVKFTNTSSDTTGATVYTWDFGNGNNSALSNPLATYDQVQTYTVSLTACNGGDCDTVTKTDVITIHRDPQASFSVDITNACYPIDISYTESSTQGDAAIMTYTWDFGDGTGLDDGTTSNVKNYFSAGTRYPSLNVIDANGCSSFFPDSDNGDARIEIEINEQPVANYHVQGDSTVCATSLNATLTHEGEGTGTLYYDWDWGDGSTSQTNSVAHTTASHSYVDTGRYDVKLVVTTDGVGCADSVTKVEKIQVDQPVLDITTDQGIMGGCPNQAINFIAVSNHPIERATWNFGDAANGSSGSTNPTYTYADTGTVNITMTVYQANCTSTIVRPFDLTAISAQFTADDPNTCLWPHTINFQNLSEGSITRYKWDFGNGDTSNLADPPYNYSVQDIYDVTLTVWDANGCRDIMDKDEYVMLMPFEFKVHNEQDSTGCKEKPMTFYAKYGNDTVAIQNIEWNFDDGTIENNTNTDVTHTYAASGVYNPTITLTNTEGCIGVYVDTIEVGDTPTFIIAQSVLPTDTICASEVVTFTNTSPKRDEIEYAWYFPNVADPQESINAAEAFRDTGWVSTTVHANHYQCRASTTIDTVAYILGPVSSFASVVGDCDDGLTITCTNFSIDADSGSHYWDMGDGTFYDDSLNFQHTYAQPGDYIISLRTENAANLCADSVTWLEEIRNPQANFIADTTVGCTGLSVHFTADTSSQIHEYIWYITNTTTGVTSVRPAGSEGLPYYTTNTMSQTFTDVGYYTIRLGAGNRESGCYNYLTIDSFIHVVDHDPGFTIDTTYGCQPFTATFTDTTRSDTTIDMYIWNWGDGDRDTTYNGATQPSHDFPRGNYRPILTVVDVLGCTRNFTGDQLRVTWPDLRMNNLPTIQCYGDTMKFAFTGHVSGPEDTVFWNYGDGTLPDTLTNQNDTVWHIYMRGGDYSVQMIGVDSNLCYDSAAQTVTIQEPTAHFYIDSNYNNSRFCNPLDILYRMDSSSSDITSYQFDFGDSSLSAVFQRSSTTTAFRQYLFNGAFDITIYGESDLGCRDTVTIDSLILIDGPTLNIFVDILETCVGTEVNFAFQSLDGNIVAYEWDYGNGITSDTITDLTDTTSSYTYNAPGSYTMGVRIFDTIPDFLVGQSCDQTKRYHLPIMIHGITTDFNIGSQGTCTPFDVDFEELITFDDNTYESTGTGIVSLEWFFDNDSLSAKIDTSSFSDPTYTFDTSGDFSIKLVVTDSLGCRDSMVYSDTIHALGSYAVLTMDTFQGCNPFSINFTNQSESDATINSVTWDFGDGNTSTSAAANVSHEFSLNGNNATDTFTVTLTVQDDAGCNNTIILTDSVKVSGPQVNFGAIDSFVCLGDTVIFDNRTNVFGGSYWWNLGHGFNSAKENPITFYNEGEYSVKLTVTDTNGCMDSMERADFVSIQVPVASFTNDSIYKYCPDLDVTFNDSSSDRSNIAEWIWYYGDGTIDTITDSSQIVQHTYTTAQTFDVRLKVVTTAGCVDDTIKPQLIQIDGPYATYPSSDTSGCRGLPINFSINTDSNNVAEYKWIFDDGDSTAWGMANTTHIYDSMGVFHPYLRIRDNATCTVNVGRIDSVHIEEVIAQFAMDTTIECQDNIFEFINQSSFSIPAANNTWKVKYGDGFSTSYDTTDTIRHRFDFAGDFEVLFYAKSGSNHRCKDTTSIMVHVDSLPIIIGIEDDTLCRGDSIQLLTSTSGTTLWSPANSISSVDSMSPTVWPSQPTAYILTVTDSIGCISRDTVNVSTSGMNYDSLLALRTSWEHGIDTGGCIPFDFTQTVDQNYYNFGSINWIVGDGNADQSNYTVTHQYTTRGDYQLQFTFTHGDNNVCVDTFTRNMFIDTLPVIQSIRHDSAVCEQDTIWLYGWGVGEASWTPADEVFNPNGRSTKAIIDRDKSFVFTLGNTSGCSTSDTVNFTAIEWLSRTLEARPTIDTIIADGTDSVYFGSSLIGNDLIYNWSPSEFLTCTDCPNPVFYGDTAARYKLEVRDRNGCLVVSDTVRLSFDYIFDSNVPQAFSPGTTPGENDVLYIRGRGIAEVVEFKVYNRWGELIYTHPIEAEGDPNVGWDGRFKGEYVPPGTYVLTAQTRSITGELSEPIYRNILIVR